MVKKLFIIFFFLIIPISSIEASIKQEIIANLKKTNNLVFDFTQTIAEKEEKGSCTIEYPKKIYCLYNNRNKKIIVSNGKSLVIKNQISNQLYFYRLKQTPLDLILDKDYLINQIENLKLNRCHVTPHCFKMVATLFLKKGWVRVKLSSDLAALTSDFAFKSSLRISGFVHLGTELLK